MNRDDIFFILEVAGRAVSTCNVQPWRFRIRDGQVDIYMLRIKNFFLKLEGNLWIELGALLENMAMGAAAKGFTIQYELFERCGLDEPAAVVTFVANSTISVSLEAVMNRCTNREDYSPKPLPESAVSAIEQSVDDPNVKIFVLTGSQKAECAEILTQLESIRFGNRLLVEEVLPYVRTSPQEIDRYRDRLDSRTLGLSDTSLRLLVLAKKYPFLRSLYHFIFSRFAKHKKVKDFYQSLMQSGALLAFTIVNRDQKSYVNLGQILQRVLNNLTREQVQTYTIISGLYLLDLLKENLEIYSQQEQIDLLRFQNDLLSFFNFSKRRLALVVKAGIGPMPKYRTLRKKVADLLV